MALPPLNLSSGPSMSEGQATGTASNSAAFYFKGSSSTSNQDLISRVAPFVLVGGLLWMLYRK